MKRTAADVAGVLARIALEVHHVSLYALLGGTEAVEALEADLGHYMNLIASENVEVWGEAASADMRAHAAKFGTPKVLPFKTLRQRLQTLLDESHTPVDLTLWYTLLYRGESTYSVHGVGQLPRYLDHDQGAIVLDPTADRATSVVRGDRNRDHRSHLLVAAPNAADRHATTR